MKIIGIIPARAGSKGVKNKNIVNVNGKPLIYYTIRAVKKSKLKSFVVSSDSSRILNIAKKYGVKKLFLRPTKYALDTTRSIELFKYLRKELEKLYSFDAIMILQPTSPMRRSKDIDKAISLFKKKRCDSLISVCSVGDHPARVKFLNKEKYLIDTKFSGKEGQNRQELRDAFINNGAIYIFKKSNLDKNTIKGKKSLSMVMSRELSINIDNYFDLELAKYFLKKNK
jgi:CMP-N,N'-diacetyllegionaminic acid synthase